MAVRTDGGAEALTRTANLPTSTSWSMLGSFTKRGTGGTPSIIAGLLASGASAYQFIGINSGNIVVQTNSTSANIITDPGNNVTFFYALTCSGTGAGNLIGYYRLVGDNTWTSASTTGNSFTPATLTLNDGSFGAWANGDHGRLIVWNAVLTADQLMAQSKVLRLLWASNININIPMMRTSVTDNAIDYSGNGRNMTVSGTMAVADNPPIPYGAPVTFIPYAASAGAYTLTAGQGSYTLTGNAATLKADRLLTAAQGAYTLTGQSAGLYRGFKVTAEQGSYSLTGNSVTLIATRLLSAAQASYSLTGQAANLIAARLLTAAHGSYNLTGQDVTLTYSGAGGHYTLTAGQGSFTLTGNAAGLSVSRVLTAGQGTITLTGNNASLVASRLLSAAQGSYVLTGQAAGLYRGLRLTANSGTYTLTGQAASLLAARILTAALGQYVLTGNPVTLTYGAALSGIAFDFSRTSVTFEDDRTVTFESNKRVTFEDDKTVEFS